MGEQRTTNIAVNVEQHEDVQYERITNAAIDVEYLEDTNYVRITNAAIMVEYRETINYHRITNGAIMVEYNGPQVIALDPGIVSLSGPRLLVVRGALPSTPQIGEEEIVIKSISTSLFVQLEPGKTSYYLGRCTAIPSVDNPRRGLDPIYRRVGQNKYEISLDRSSPPGMISMIIERLHKKTASWLDKTSCPFTFFILQRCAGEEGLFSEWVTGQSIAHCNIINDPIGNIQQRDAADEMLHSYELVGYPPRIDYYPMSTHSLSTSEGAVDANCITTTGDIGCQDEGCVSLPCVNVFVGFDALNAGVTANVQHSHDSGETWAATATDPFEIGQNITAIKSYVIDSNSVRVIAFRGSSAGFRLRCTYSDNMGITWAPSIGVGDTNGEGVISANAFELFDKYNMWVGTSSGRIYRSKNSGITWTEQTSAFSITAGNDIYGIDFCSPEVGVAVGENSTIIRTEDGGETWSSVTPTTGPGVTFRDVHVFSNKRWLIGASNGYTYMTYNSGNNWTRLSNWSDGGTGVVTGFDFVDEQNGFMTHNLPGGSGFVYRTIDGGYSWVPIEQIGGSQGLNEVVSCDINNAFAVGNSNTIIKASSD